MTFREWLKLHHPRFKRTHPVARTQSGSRRSIETCICGDWRSYASQWPVPKRVAQWRTEHNETCWLADVPRAEAQP